MNLIGIITNSALGQRLFAEDLSDRADGRKKLVGKIELYKKQLNEQATKSDKQISSVDAEIKKVEAQLSLLREKRGKLINDSNLECVMLGKQIKAAETELKQQAPAVLVSAYTAINSKVRGKRFLQQDKVEKAKELMAELDSLLYCLDNARILNRAVAIESAASNL